MRAMKSIGSILIFMIVAHSQCTVQCLGADLYRPAARIEVPLEQPACHQHAQKLPAVPSSQDSTRHEHDNGNSCGQAQTKEFKLAPILDGGLQLLPIEFDVSSISLQQVTNGR